MNEASFEKKKKGSNFCNVFSLFFFFDCTLTFGKRSPSSSNTLLPNFPDHTLDFFFFLLALRSFFSFFFFLLLQPLLFCLLSDSRSCSQ